MTVNFKYSHFNVVWLMTVNCIEPLPFFREFLNIHVHVLQRQFHQARGIDIDLYLVRNRHL